LLIAAYGAVECGDLSKIILANIKQKSNKKGSAQCKHFHEKEAATGRALHAVKIKKRFQKLYQCQSKF
jgi:hypothetical protein